MTVTILKGDCRDVLATLPDESVHCVVTSPPYWGLRDYGVAGQIGLEAGYAEYVDAMVGVFREVRRVLEEGGTVWLNLGDSYATGAGKVGERPGGGAQGDAWNGHRGSRGGSAKQPHTGSAIGPMIQPNRMPQSGLKPKDLTGIPWRVAFALQADGWYLRQDIIWSKPNPMPESVRDRCTKAHEYLFLLSKSERYYYDADAIAEESVYKAGEGGHQRFGKPGGKAAIEYGKQVSGEIWQSEGTRNKRSVWEVTTAPYADAHFATFPPALIEPCILAGCPEFTCSECGTVLDKHIKSAIRSSTNGTQAKDTTDSRLRMVREASDTGSQEQAEAILQQGLRVSLDCQEPEHEQGALHHVEGLHRDLHAGPSERDEGRLCDGTSISDGGEDRSAAVGERDRASPERRSTREPREQSGSASQVSTRQAAEGENGQGVLPSLQRHNNAVPTCPHCQANLARVGAIVPGTVLDCFGGAGTTGLVADRLGRNAILIELNPDYADMAERRIRGDAGMFAEVAAG